ncbi:unnamed protein product, partial [Adineta ricciae]
LLNMIYNHTIFRKKNYREGHILVASTLRVIGNIYRHLKQFDDALHYHYKSLEMREKLQSPDNFLSKQDLGETYLEMGNTKDAIECFHFTYETEKIDKHCDFKQAEQIFKEILLTQHELYPNGNSQIGTTLHRMGTNYLEMNEIDEAILCFENSLEIFKQFHSLDRNEIKLVNEKLLQAKNRKKSNANRSSLFLISSNQFYHVYFCRS